MIEQGLGLMVAGMGTVFLFLTTMVIVMYGSSVVLRKFDKKPPSKKKTGSGGTTPPRDELAKIAVAIAAVKAHSRG